MGEKIMNQNIQDVRQKLLNLAIKVNNDFELNKDYESNPEHQNITVHKGFILDIYIPTVLVGSYRRLNLKRSDEKPIKVFQRLQVEMRYINENSKYIVKAGKFHSYHDWKNEMTQAEFEIWLYKVEQLIKNHTNTDPKYFSQIERGITYD